MTATWSRCGCYNDLMRVVVVGGGIVGASAAYHLTTAGMDVVTVDRGDAGAATSAGAGIIFPWATASADPSLVEVMFAAAEYYPGLVDGLGVRPTEVGYARVGGLLVGHDDDQLDQVMTTLEQRRTAGAGAGAIGALTRLAAGEPAGRFAPLDPSLGGVSAAGAARVDGDALRRALRAAAGAAGATTVSAPATLEVRAGRVQGVRAGAERVDADAVILAGGAWSAELCGPLGVDLPVAPQRGQIVHLLVPGLDTEEAPVVQPLGTSHYLLAFPGSRVVVGATRETGAGFDYRLTAAGLLEVLGRALEVAPGLADATVLETRIGFRPATPDGAPLLGTLERWDNVVVATGLGPYGLTVGPLAGAVAAAMVSGRAAPVDVGAFRPERPMITAAGAAVRAGRG
jgi:D-amino-acid dehydrogenase